MGLIIFSRIREDLQSWQTRWAFLMACWSQGVCGYLIAYTAVVFFHTLAGLSHMLPQNVKTSRLKCSFVPFFFPVYVLLSSFVYFLKIFPFCLHFLAKASLCFYNCNLLLVPLPVILPKISHKCASRASVPRGVNRKSKITFYLPQSNLSSSGIMLKYKTLL